MATDGIEAGAESTGSRPSLLTLFKVVGYKQVIELLRYPVNTVTLFLSLFVFFALIFIGGKTVAGAALTDSLDGLVVGYFLWTLASWAFRDLAVGVMNEARWGTLERLFVSPYGIGRVMAVKTIVSISLGIVWSGVMLVAMMFITGRWLDIDPLTVLPLMLLTLAPVVGIGFLLAGLAVVYKRIESLFNIASFMFAGLIAVPVERFELLKLLPMTQGSHLTGRAMAEGIHLWEFAPTELIYLVVPAVVYLLVGFYGFHRLQRRARREGTLGQY